jgi:hypothetical protein
MIMYGVKDWFTIWNSLDLVAYALQIAIAVLYLGRMQLDSLALSVLLAAQILLLFWKVGAFNANRVSTPLCHVANKTCKADANKTCKADEMRHWVRP